jgi:hypothetical protein
MSNELWNSDPVAAAALAVRSGLSSAAEVLNTAELPADIPLLATLGPKPPAGSWTRFIGMVQDVWDEELYVVSDHQGHSALLAETTTGTDSLSLWANDARPVFGERLPIYLVTPPGLTTWSHSAINGQTPTSVEVPSTTLSCLKRQRDDSDAVDIAMSDNAEPDGSDSFAGDTGVGIGEDPRGHREKRTATDVPRAVVHPGLGRNLPVPPRAGTAGAPCAVIAKLYDAKRSIRLHSLVEVIGVVHPGPVGRLRASPGEDMCEWLADEDRNPAGIPRIHVVSMRTLDDESPDPLCPLIGPLAAPASISRASAFSELKDQALPTMREMVVRYLASALGGDMIAAEYLLFCLVGRPAMRSEEGVVVGKLTLNLVLHKRAGTLDVEGIVGALEGLVPALVHLRVTIPVLNDTEMYPKKSYEANRLQASPLQLPTGCLLIADETDLDNGKLLERGVKNVRALATVAQKAAVPVDFQFYESELLFNGNTLLLSSDCKSILPGDVVVRVVAPKSDIGLLPWQSYDGEMMRKLRIALSLLAEDGKFTIPDDTGRVIGDTFVDARKCGVVSADSEQVLSRWLAVARTAARSFGENHLSADRWNYAVGRDREVESRNADAIAVTRA